MSPNLTDPEFWHRFQFAFTLIYHYLFPQLTMGLAWFIVAWKWKAMRTGDERYAKAARFWAKIFGLNFSLGVVTGIPMEFQFGTNWAIFSKYSGEVIGQTLAMEGMFAFLLESALVGALVWGEKRLSVRSHFLVAVGVATGSWLSGYFILVTNSFMQHPVGYTVGPDGRLLLDSIWTYLTNPWAFVQFAHNQAAALVTGSFAVAALGAFYTLSDKHRGQARLYLKYGVVAGLMSSILVAFPTGDRQAKIVAKYQEVSLAAMEGRFESGPMAGLVLIGQPNVAEHRLDNAVVLPGALSFLAYGTFHSNVRGLDAFPRDTWPDNLELLYYSFHIMAGLGTIFILVMMLAGALLYLRRLERSRWLLWVLMLAFPFPYIANTVGWMTAELGRQPWLVYGLFRTRDGFSRSVGSGSTVFTLIGFCGLYFVLGVLFLFLVGREIAHGPSEEHAAEGHASGIFPRVNTRRGNMVELWYTILTLTLTIYLVLDGRNFGAGAVHLMVARPGLERRQVVAAIGPLWSWHEVWIVATGGILFVAFPRLMGTAFTGYYLAIFLLLWSLILRGIALEVGGHLDNRLWQQFWDAVFAISSVALAFLFGVALGNLARGVPLDGKGDFQMAFFTDFRVGGHVGLLDWYTISMGLFFLVLLAAHGATYLMVKTEGPVQERSRLLAKQLWALVGVGLAVISIETWTVHAAILGRMGHHPLAWLALAVVVVAAASIAVGLRRDNETLAFTGSWLFIAGFLGAAAASLFPMMLYSTLGAEHSLTAYNSSSSHKSLVVAIFWWPISFVLATSYFIFILRKYRGKVKPLQDSQGYY